MRLAAHVAGGVLGILTYYLFEWSSWWLLSEIPAQSQLDPWWLLVAGIAGVLATYIPLWHLTYRDRWVMATMVLTYLGFFALAGTLGALTHSWANGSYPGFSLLWSPLLSLFISTLFSPVLLPLFWPLVKFVDARVMKTIDVQESERVLEARARRQSGYGRPPRFPRRSLLEPLHERLWLHLPRHRQIKSGTAFFLTPFLGLGLGLLMGTLLTEVQRFGRGAPFAGTAQILAGLFAGLIMATITLANLTRNRNTITCATASYFAGAVTYGFTGAALNTLLKASHSPGFDALLDSTVVFGFWSLAVSPLVYPALFLYVAGVDRHAMSMDPHRTKPLRRPSNS